MPASLSVPCRGRCSRTDAGGVAACQSHSCDLVDVYRLTCRLSALVPDGRSSACPPFALLLGFACSQSPLPCPVLQRIVLHEFHTGCRPAKPQRTVTPRKSAVRSRLEHPQGAASGLLFNLVHLLVRLLVLPSARMTSCQWAGASQQVPVLPTYW